MSLGRRAKSGEKAPFYTPAKIEEERAVETAKIDRLKALRLAKEAADRSAEEDAAATRAGVKPSGRVRRHPRTSA